MIKRLFDIAVAVLGLSAVAPVMLVCMMAVRFSSPGPVFFRQQRIGQHGRIFKIVKLRTMCVANPGAPLVQITIGADPRITRAGAFLRRWKLDELPQLWNVLIGDMSLVGPRPEVPDYVAIYPQSTRDLILSVRPGITDPCSISFRNESDFLATADDPERFYVEKLLPQKLKISMDYVNAQSFTSDIIIIFKTIFAVLR